MNAYSLCSHTSKLFIFSVLVVLTCRDTARSDDYSQSGLITLHLKGVATPISQCFTPVFIEDKFLICTVIGSITERSQIGIKIGNEDVWTPFCAVIENGWGHSTNMKQYIFDCTEGPICFFPLKNEEPSESLTRNVWSEIRNRAIDLKAAAKRMDMPNTAVLSGYKTGKNNEIIPQFVDVGVKIRQEIYNPYRSVADEPLYLYKLDMVLSSSSEGASFFKIKISCKDDVLENFLGMAAVNEDNTGSEDRVVMVDHYAILRFYEQHIGLRPLKWTKQRIESFLAPSKSSEKDSKEQSDVQELGPALVQ